MTELGLDVCLSFLGGGFRTPVKVEGIHPLWGAGTLPHRAVAPPNTHRFAGGLFIRPGAVPTSKSDTSFPSRPRQSWYPRGHRARSVGADPAALRGGGGWEGCGVWDVPPPPPAPGSSVPGPAGSAVGVRLHRGAAGCPHAAGGPFPVGAGAPPTPSSPSRVLCRVDLPPASLK